MCYDRFSLSLYLYCKTHLVHLADYSLDVYHWPTPVTSIVRLANNAVSACRMKIELLRDYVCKHQYHARSVTRYMQVLQRRARVEKACTGIVLVSRCMMLTYIASLGSLVAHSQRCDDGYLCYFHFKELSVCNLHSDPCYISPWYKHYISGII